jgi:hypothetical protein
VLAAVLLCSTGNVGSAQSVPGELSSVYLRTVEAQYFRLGLAYQPQENQAQSPVLGHSLAGYDSDCEATPGNHSWQLQPADCHAAVLHALPRVNYVPRCAHEHAGSAALLKTMTATAQQTWLPKWVGRLSCSMPSVKGST